MSRDVDIFIYSYIPLELGTNIVNLNILKTNTWNICTNIHKYEHIPIHIYTHKHNIHRDPNNPGIRASGNQRIRESENQRIIILINNKY